MSDQGFRRRLSALLSADVEGYSLLMRDDEEATVRTVTAFRAAISNQIQQYRGRVVDSPGDNILAEFTSVVDAVNCAVEIQREIAERNLELPENRRMRWRIGVNLGDVIEDGQRIYGDGVNVAARMESLAEGGGICLSGTVYDAIENKIGLEYEYLGEQAVKNIPKPIRAYRVLSYPGAAAHRVIKAKKAEGKKWRHVGLAAAAAAIAVAGLVVWYCWLRPPSIKTIAPKPPGAQVKALPLPHKPSIAVLPFVNTSGDPKQDFLSDGITEQIIYALSKVPGIFVIARQSSFFYKGKKVKVRQVGRELGVHYVVEGSVDRSGDRLRITAQLIDARTGVHLWSDRYDRKLEDIFALQDEITVKIITAVGAKLTHGDRIRVMAKGTSNVEALITVMRGNEYWWRATREGIFQARKMARRAIALDPKYPDAYCLLASTYFMQPFYDPSASPRHSFKQAFKFYQMALALDKNHPTVNSYLSIIYSYQRQYQKGVEQASRAVATNPGFSDAYLSQGIALVYAARYREAIQALKKGLRINPKYPPWFFQFLGHAYSRSGQYRKAIPFYKKALFFQPNALYIHTGLAFCYVLTGHKRKARKQVAEVLRINPNFSLKWYEKIIPGKDEAMKKRMIVALRRAGLK